MRIVFDLDGTLANPAHRQHFLEKEPRDWDGFFEACDKDAPIDPAIETLIALNRATDKNGDQHRIEIWSGRGEGKDRSVRKKTLRWLWDHCRGQITFAEFSNDHGYFGSRGAYARVRMRPHGDHTPDEILKKAWLDAARAHNKEPHLIFDDRQKVVDMWRAEGIICFQVAPGNF